MNEPATTHDNRCPTWSADNVECDCRDNQGHEPLLIDSPTIQKVITWAFPPCEEEEAS